MGDTIKGIDYLSDWNEIMRVVDKIEAIREDVPGFPMVNEAYCVKIQMSGSTIESVLNNPDLMPRKYEKTLWVGKKTSTWLSIIAFILWYNKQKK